MANSYLDQNDSYLDAPQAAPRRRTGPNPVATLPTTYAQQPVDRTQLNNSFSTPADNQFAQPATRQPPLDNNRYINSIANPPPAPPLTANQLGRNIGQGIAGQFNSAADVVNQTAIQPALRAARGIADFGSGIVGGGPVQTTPSFTGEAQAATPNTAPTPAAPGETYRGPMARNPNDATWSMMANTSSPPAVANNVAPRGIQSLINAGVGQMVNGVPTFRNNPGATNNTVSDEWIKRAGAAPSTPYTGPEGGVLSAAGVNTPQQGVTFAALNRLPQGYQQGGYDPQAVQSRAQSDIADILGKDPRSTLGRAAWNASVDLSHASRRSRYGGGPSAYENAQMALINQVNENLNAGNKAALNQQESGFQDQRQGSNQAFELARQQQQNQFNLGALGQKLGAHEPKGFTEAHAKLLEWLGNQAVPDASGKMVNPTYEQTLQRFNALTNDGQRAVTHTGTDRNGRTVARYSDGTTGYLD